LADVDVLANVRFVLPAQPVDATHQRLTLTPPELVKARI
jgi:hypothetical protein